MDEEEYMEAEKCNKIYRQISTKYSAMINAAAMLTMNSIFVVVSRPFCRVDRIK